MISKTTSPIPNKSNSTHAPDNPISCNLLIYAVIFAIKAQTTKMAVTINKIIKNMPAELGTDELEYTAIRLMQESHSSARVKEHKYIVKRAHQ